MSTPESDSDGLAARILNVPLRKPDPEAEEPTLLGELVRGMVDEHNVEMAYWAKHPLLDFKKRKRP